MKKKLIIQETNAPEARKGGIKVGSVDELLDKLKNEAKVLWSLFNNYLLCNNKSFIQFQIKLTTC